MAGFAPGSALPSNNAAVSYVRAVRAQLLTARRLLGIERPHLLQAGARRAARQEPQVAVRTVVPTCRATVMRRRSARPVAIWARCVTQKRTAATGPARERAALVRASMGAAPTATAARACRARSTTMCLAVCSTAFAVFLPNQGLTIISTHTHTPDRHSRRQGRALLVLPAAASECCTAVYCVCLCGVDVL